jgi:hypothetical protein
MTSSTASLTYEMYTEMTHVELGRISNHTWLHRTANCVRTTRPLARSSGSSMRWWCCSQQSVVFLGDRYPALPI